MMNRFRLMCLESLVVSFTIIEKRIPFECIIKNHFNYYIQTDKINVLSLINHLNVLKYPPSHIEHKYPILLISKKYFLTNLLH